MAPFVSVSLLGRWYSAISVLYRGIAGRLYCVMKGRSIRSEENLSVGEK